MRAIKFFGCKQAAQPKITLASKHDGQFFLLQIDVACKKFYCEHFCNKKILLQATEITSATIFFLVCNQKILLQAREIISATKIFRCKIRCKKNFWLQVLLQRKTFFAKIAATKKFCCRQQKLSCKNFCNKMFATDNFSGKNASNKKFLLQR